MTDDVVSLVRKGMAYLDERYPGHDARVNLDTLNVGDSIRCPLAQAHGAYYAKAREAQHLSEQASIKLGFSVAHYGIGQVLQDLQALTDEWRHQYTQRAEAKALADNGK